MLEASKDLNTVGSQDPLAKAVRKSRLSARSVVYAPFGRALTALSKNNSLWAGPDWLNQPR